MYRGDHRFCKADSRRFMPHFHIPASERWQWKFLLEWSDVTKRELYQTRVEQIRRQYLMHVLVWMWSLVFPGETEEHFMNTYRFIRTWTYLIFMFSLIRKGKTLQQLKWKGRFLQQSVQIEMKCWGFFQKEKRAFASSQLVQLALFFGNNRMKVAKFSDGQITIVGLKPRFGVIGQQTLYQRKIYSLSPSGSIILS